MKKQKILYSVQPTSLIEVSFSKLQLRVIPESFGDICWSSSPPSLSGLKVPAACRERWNVGIPPAAARLRMGLVCTLEGKRDHW